MSSNALSERGGVLGAMETGYQRGKIQDESMYYEHRKHDSSLPIVGVNTFVSPEPEPEMEIELARSTEQEKQSQIARLNEFKQRHAEQAPEALARLRTQHGAATMSLPELMTPYATARWGKSPGFFRGGWAVSA